MLLHSKWKCIKIQFAKSFYYPSTASLSAYSCIYPELSSNFVDLQEFQAKVDEKLDEILRGQRKMLKLLLEQKQGKENLEALQSGNFGESFSQVYNISFPLATMELLFELDTNLQGEDCQRDFVSLMSLNYKDFVNYVIM